MKDHIRAVEIAINALEVVIAETTDKAIKEHRARAGSLKEDIHETYLKARKIDDMTSLALADIQSAKRDMQILAEHIKISAIMWGIFSGFVVHVIGWILGILI